MSKLQFKYKAEMEALDIICPPNTFSQKEILGFRWVYDTVDDKRNFVPQYFKIARYKDAPNHEVRCQSMGISLFDSENAALKKFRGLQKIMNHRAFMLLGTSIAKGTILTDFGVVDSPNKEGHFTLHPIENIDLAEHFVVISKLN